MLYHLFEYLQRIGLDFPGERLMNYISFRAICCSIVAILTSMLVGKKIIATLQKKKQAAEDAAKLKASGVT